MATSKTLAPTNVTISIPAMTDQPNASVLANCADKEADAINALNSQKANVSKYPNTNKLLSIATDGSSDGFRIQYPSTGAISILYADIYGRFAHVYRSSGNASLQMINGTFNGSSLSETETFLNVGNWVRAQMIITSSDGVIDNIQVGTYQS